MTKDLRKRMGRFTLSWELLETDTDDAVLQLFAGVVVMRATDDLYKRSIEYLAVSPAFDLVPEGAQAPTYIAEYTQLPEGTEVVSWRKI